MGKTISIEIPDGKKAEWVNGVLTLVDEAQVENRPITERIKTFEDACEELGEQHRFVQEWEEADATDFTTPDILAYLKLRIICAALNEDWQPQFTEDEYRWFPWFRIYSKKEIDDMSEEDRSRVVGRSGSGSRLAFKTEDLAIYAGKQFIDIWADFICGTTL